MASQGYARFPHIFQDQVVFVAEDDLWLVSREGGRAERLTASVGEVSYPRFSHDGKLLAFVGREEGSSEVYVMSSDGEPARRLTYNEGNCRVLGWSADDQEILYASNAGQYASRYEVIYAVKLSGGLPRKLPVGMANAISYGPRGGVVIGRNIQDTARWKRYRGGTAGHLWCDIESNGTFTRLLHLNGNMADPCWIDDHIYFISDHEGVGNLYSCTPRGEDIRRHSDHQDFYARNLSSDGHSLVYHAGAELFLYDPALAMARHLEVQLPSTRTQRNRKFVSAASYLDSYALHPEGHSVVLTARGKAFSMGNWEGPALQHGELDGVRYRFLEWLNDGKRLLAICDAPEREAIVVFSPTDAAEPKLYSEIEFGRVVDLAISPTDDVVAITNHRNELISVNLEDGARRVVDRSTSGRIAGFSWSPDGRWLAYGFPISPQKTAIKLANLESGETYQVTEPVLQDIDPAFDPEGKYLYFLGYRIFRPVYDSLQFDLSFPRGVKPYAIMLRKDLRSPFIPEPKSLAAQEKEEKPTQPPQDEADATDPKEDASDGDQKETASEQSEDASEDTKEATAIEIDLEGITSRVLPFPVGEGRYRAIYGIKGKALILSYALEPASSEALDDHRPRGVVEYYDFENYKSEKLIDGVSDFGLSRDNKTLIYRSYRRLRVLKAGDKPKADHGERPGRESGWLDLQRIKISIHPLAEWKQMFAEAWRLQREQFWAEDMSGIDWEAIYKRYAPLVGRIGSRSELSDLFWEVQGELGTSHAYEYGGEYRHRPHYHQGFLGVDWSYDEERDRYRITHILRGDPSDRDSTSPLTLPGLNVAEGDALLAINGQRVSRERTPQELLVNLSGNEVQLTIESAETRQTRSIIVKALDDEQQVRYREWVEHNRRVVHEASQNRVGYIHIPDMMADGFAEFHRSFLTEYDFPALLVDVRWNRGGHVSGLLLEKLARRRVGYDFPRWGQPNPYPDQSPRGPMVALTNEHAGSDGDIFSHSFKLMGLGPLIGKRTWGGVIGISPRHRLVDGTVTTQPEYSFWFKDVGWNVENYGTDPDIEVDIAPQDYVNNVDPQLERAIAEALRMIEERPGLEPNPGERPRLAPWNIQ